jgi:hypothetical protein
MIKKNDARLQLSLLAGALAAALLSLAPASRLPEGIAWLAVVLLLVTAIVRAPDRRGFTAYGLGWAGVIWIGAVEAVWQVGWIRDPFLALLVGAVGLIAAGWQMTWLIWLLRRQNEPGKPRG